MKNGRVKFYNVSKGFGFINDLETGEDVFVHATGINEDTRINEGDEVTFDVIEGKKGLNAINVQLV